MEIEPETARPRHTDETPEVSATAEWVAKPPAPADTRDSGTSSRRETAEPSVPDAAHVTAEAQAESLPSDGAGSPRQDGVGSPQDGAGSSPQGSVGSSPEGSIGSTEQAGTGSPQRGNAGPSEEGAVEAGEDDGPHPWRAFRERIARRPTLDLAYRIGVGVLGAVVLIVGCVAIPYPGPGWAMVFLGLGILATEFTAARRALTWVRGRYDRVMSWYRAQGRFVQVLGFLGTCAVVVGTLWLLGTVGMFCGWIGVDYAWTKSPLLS